MCVKVLRFLRFSRAKGGPERKKNNKKDSTEIKKTIKDSEEFGIF